MTVFITGKGVDSSWFLSPDLEEGWDSGREDSEMAAGSNGNSLVPAGREITGRTASFASNRDTDEK